MKLLKSEILHLVRIGLVPFFTISILYESPQHFDVAAIIFCIFWTIKGYAKYIAKHEKKNYYFPNNK